MKAVDKKTVYKASFLIKLFKILRVKSFNKYIRWSQNGNYFIIVNKRLFEKKILPKYFAHKKFSSFNRQLNLYNFSKVKFKNGEKGYVHEEFNSRTSVDEIMLIKKKIKIKDEKKNDNENNKEENKIIENDSILKFQNLDEKSKINRCENILKKGELSKNDNQLVLIYLLDKNKENIETIKNLQNKIKILNDENKVLKDQLIKFGNNYNCSNEADYYNNKDFIYFNNYNYNTLNNSLKSSYKSNYNNSNRNKYYYNSNNNSLKGSQISNYNN